MMDRASNGPVIVGSAVGGVNIETIAHETPDAIIKVFFLSFLTTLF
jgi:succinyl-CoA synthetase beta subunit